MIDYRRALDAIRADPRYQNNIDWGEPRDGHPEGAVRAHIAELERNLQTLVARISEVERDKLLLVIHTHDTFKADAEAGVPIEHPRSHASLAREFLTEYCVDPDLLDLVQYHDEPYALWRQAEQRGRCNPERRSRLLTRIHDWDLFLAFAIIDGCTVGKSRAPLYWLFDQLAGKVQSRVTVEDVF